MKKIALFIALIFFLHAASLAAALSFNYNFPKPPNGWGKPVSFNNLSPGFFQVMFQDSKGIIRIATYGIAGGSMDTLNNPQLLMVFTFDQEKVSLADQ